MQKKTLENTWNPKKSRFSSTPRPPLKVPVPGSTTGERRYYKIFIFWHFKGFETHPIHGWGWRYDSSFFPWTQIGILCCLLLFWQPPTQKVGKEMNLTDKVDGLRNFTTNTPSSINPAIGNWNTIDSVWQKWWDHGFFENPSIRESFIFLNGWKDHSETKNRKRTQQNSTMNIEFHEIKTN